MHGKVLIATCHTSDMNTIMRTLSVVEKPRQPDQNGATRKRHSWCLVLVDNVGLMEAHSDGTSKLTKTHLQCFNVHK